MGKSLRPRPGKQRFGGRSLFFVNFILVMVPLTYFGYQPLLRSTASIIISDSEPKKADAIVLLGGGEAGRAWGAADLYRDKFGSYVVVTAEPLLPDEAELRKIGIEVATGLDNNVRILRALGVPEEKIIRVEPYVQDTFDELVHVGELAAEKHWKSLVIVTSNYHTRRTRFTAKYVFRRTFEFTVVASKHGGLNRSGWWQNRRDVRTFLIEFEKLVAYTLYIGPRMLWTSLRSTNPPSMSSVEKRIQLAAERVGQNV